MKTKEELKTLKVSEENWREIQRIKIEGRFSTADEVISNLIKVYFKTIK